MLTGHDLTEAAARMRAKREKVIETEKVELDRDEVAAMRRDMATVLENISIEFARQLDAHDEKLQKIASVVQEIGKAADRELNRK